MRERRRPLDELARRLEVTTRTIRRDLAALQAAGFPLFDDQTPEGRMWRLLAIDEWPKGLAAPTEHRDIRPI